jgi:hypothetical protein
MNKNGGIAALYKSKSTVFTPKNLAAVWGISNYNYLKTRIQYYLKRGYLYRIHHSLYVKDKNDYDILEAANKLRTPSYISFETVLFREGIVFQKYTGIFLASYCSKTVQTSSGNFVYRRLKDEILFNNQGIINTGTYSIATKERAFVDSIYLYKNYYFDNLRPLDWEKVSGVADIYRSKALKMRVEEYRKDAQQE